MKKIYILIITVFLYIFAYAQEEETIRIKINLKDEHGYEFKVMYHVLKSDTTVKHGYYERYDIINSLEETGYYKYGVKDSIWKTFIIGKYIGSIGNYKNGKRNGEWKYYTNVGTLEPDYERKSPTRLVKSGYYVDDTLVGVWSYYKKGVIEQQYDHSKDSLIFSINLSDNYFYTIKTDTGIVKQKLERPPMLVGGDITRIENRKNMDNGKLHQLSNGQENVTYVLSFWIKPNGETYGYIMVKGVNEEYDTYIIEYYKANYKWIPGQINGSNIECKMTVSEGYIVKM